MADPSPYEQNVTQMKGWLEQDPARAASQYAEVLHKMLNLQHLCNSQEIQLRKVATKDGVITELAKAADAREANLRQGIVNAEGRAANAEQNLHTIAENLRRVIKSLDDEDRTLRLILTMLLPTLKESLPVDKTEWHGLEAGLQKRFAGAGPQGSSKKHKDQDTPS